MKKIDIHFHHTELNKRSIRYFARFIIQYGTYQDKINVGGKSISYEHCSINMGQHTFESTGKSGNTKTNSNLWFKHIKKETRIDKVTIEVTDEQWTLIYNNLLNWVGKGKYSILLAMFSEIEDWGIIPKFIKRKIYKSMRGRNKFHFCSKYIQMSLVVVKIVKMSNLFTPNELVKALLSKGHDLDYGYKNG